MPYKPSLMTALNAEYEDAAQKFLASRNVCAEDAERYLYRMKLIGKDMEYTQKMIDGTVGRVPLASTAPGYQGQAAVVSAPAVR